VLLAEQLAEHPLLLDDLLDPRAEPKQLNRAAIAAEIDQALSASADDDVEAPLLVLAEKRQSVAFRIAQAALFERLPPASTSRHLAALADAVLTSLLPMALAELTRQHGRLPGTGPLAGLAVIGYGSLGGEELGFGSDLDLVFLFDDSIDVDSDGPRPLDATRYRLRAVQKVLALLSTLTPAGRLYEVDLRLRPDGAKGLLLTGLRSFAEYQRSRAWTWEHQALVRARLVTGDPTLGQRFAEIRREVLCRQHDPEAVRADVARMRQKMRSELDRSSRLHFDLKQGEGGLVDLEFLLQAAVLSHAQDVPALLDDTRTPILLDALAACGGIDPAALDELQRAHRTLLGRALDCSLDARPRLVQETTEIAHARSVVRRAWERAGLADGPSARPSSRAPS
jgi:[glutamine synthetase] adenylyltransferase / [glutamine synthetase]-adenylyl-L-tyrosine phosphorylase